MCERETRMHMHIHKQETKFSAIVIDDAYPCTIATNRVAVSMH